MSRRDDLDGVFAAIDGALADDDFPDAMRWSPEPESVDTPEPYDGELVWQPLQRYESIEYRPGTPPFELLDAIRAQVRIQSAPVAWTSTASDPLDNAVRALRARDRVIDRAQRRGPTADLVIFDEAYLVDPAHREEVLARRREASQRALAQFGEVFHDVVEAVNRFAESIGPTLQSIAEALVGLRPQAPPPPTSLRESDPRAYALELRRTRGTGPDRQVQHQPRPRRHR